jgi:ATP-dependent Clp protease, protease subunit
VTLNQRTPRRHEIVTSADGAEATVYVYDFIGSDGWGGGVSADQFVKELAALKAPTINLRINSPGGDAFDGRAIASAIRQHKSKTIAHVDGLAASAASTIAIAADEVRMAPGAMMMIHRASGIAWGTAEDFLSLAAVLEKIDGVLVDEYARETGQSADQVQAWMNAETWFTAEEAVSLGFADAIAEDAPQVEAKWNLSAYDNAPAVPADEPAAEDTESSEAEAQHADNLRRFDLAKRATA